MISVTPRLSIITPVFNNKTYIERCITSVLEQKSNSLEHIIIDAQSTDGTLEIINDYASRYTHIRWISEPDQGQSDAMNKGITMAKGEIIGFLNVDDYYEPRTIEKILKIFENLSDPSLLVGNCKVWNEFNQLVSINQPRKLNLEDLLLGFHVNPFPINPSAYFYHASLHKKIGCYDINEHYVLDVDFLFRAVQVAKIKYIDDILGNYCMLEGSKTFNSIKSRQSPYRVERLIKKYRKVFPWKKQLELAFKYSAFKFIRRTSYLAKRLAFYVINSHKLRDKLIKR